MDNKRKFDVIFRQWLNEALENGVPQSVQAFSFNLFDMPECDGVKYGVEIIGTSKFDLIAPDWACEEIWEPATRVLDIPLSFSGATWEECLSAVRSLIQGILETDNVGTRLLKSRHGIGIGFVDGDMHIVWHKTSARS